MVGTSLSRLMAFAALGLGSVEALGCGDDAGKTVEMAVRPDAGTAVDTMADGGLLHSDIDASLVHSDADGSLLAADVDATLVQADAEAGVVASVFTEAPACETTHAYSTLKVFGKLGTFAVDYEDSGFSSILNIGFMTLDIEDNRILHDLNLNWAGWLKAGEVHSLTGNALTIPDTATGGAGPFCVLGGEVAAAPQAPAQGSLFFFHITKVQARSSREPDGATCMGPILDADLHGCVHRTTDDAF